MVEAHDSYISGNEGYDIKNECSEDWDFTRNWWGESTTRVLRKHGETVNLPFIADGYDSPGKGKVRIGKFLLKRPTLLGANVSTVSAKGTK